MDMSTGLGLNLLLRGAAVGVLLLVAAMLWRDHARSTAARLGALTALSVAAATLATMPGFAGLPFPLRLLVSGPAAASMFVFWLFTCALFDDDFVTRGWHALAWLALAGLGVANCAAALPPPSPWAQAANLALAAVPATFAVLAIAQSLARWREDLVERRRELRTLVVAATSLYTLAQVLAAWVSGTGLREVVESTANAGGVFVLTLFVAWRLLRPDHGGLFGAAEVPALAATAPHPQLDPAPTSVPASALGPIPSSAAPPDPAPLPAADPRQVDALVTLMTVDHLYREPDLTIGALAERLGLPEHKLRRLINQGLGHRNFSAFLNTWRLADARRWLSDPQQANTPILTIAMDAGFQSIGPFNRAFKADTGMTPTEFRRAGGAPAAPVPPGNLAESGIG
ncbi:AraC family transcriptional regulator [Variovorax robiniae]|uniref:AraC family transcriptional regulator n=1 Tax=Variovorax robiniae TaxID=1836199 RepID=A0ABU8XE54_9BURK